MKLCLDPCLATRPRLTAESHALAEWYNSRPTVRRLWGIRKAQTLRVIVAVEATHDSDDVFPVWLANIDAWANELQSRTACEVQLELIGELPTAGIELEPGSVIVADLFWRDATLAQPRM